jgi:hypothetical protein
MKKKILLTALLSLVCGTALAAEGTISITVGSGTTVLGAAAATGPNVGAFSSRINIGDATDPHIGAQVDANGLHVVIGSTLPAFASNPTVILGAGSALAGKVGIDQTTPGTTNAVQVLTGSTTAVTQATAANLNATVIGAGSAGTPNTGVMTMQGIAGATPVIVQGTAASGASATGNPNLGGCLAVSGPQTAVANAQAVAAECDLNGRQIVVQNGGAQQWVSGCATATGTSATSVISAPGAGLKIYVTDISVSNSGSTNSLVTIQNDPLGTPVTLWVLSNPATFGGSNMKFTTPLVPTVAVKAVGFTAGASSTTQTVCIAGFTGP